MNFFPSENELIDHEPKWLQLFILLADVDSQIGIYLKNKLRICERCINLFNCKVSLKLKLFLIYWNVFYSQLKQLNGFLVSRDHQKIFQLIIKIMFLMIYPMTLMKVMRKMHLKMIRKKKSLLLNHRSMNQRTVVSVDEPGVPCSMHPPLSWAENSSGWKLFPHLIILANAVYAAWIWIAKQVLVFQ